MPLADALRRLLRGGDETREGTPAAAPPASAELSASPTRDPSWWGASGFGAAYASGRAPAENCATVLSCVSAISTAIATLPAYVVEKLPDGTKRQAPDHPLQRI